MVIPHGHDEDHTLFHCFAHLLESTLGFVGVGVLEDFLLSSTGLVSDRVVGKSTNLCLWMLDLFTVLDEESLDFNEITLIGVVTGNELGHNGEWFVSVDLFAWSEEVFNTHSEGIDIATVLVADTLISLSGVVVTAF